MEYTPEYWHDASCREVVENETAQLLYGQRLRLAQALFNVLKAPQGRDTAQISAGLYGYTVDQQLWVLFDLPGRGVRPNAPVQHDRLRVLLVWVAAQAQPQPSARATQEANLRHSVDAICP